MPRVMFSSLLFLQLQRLGLLGALLIVLCGLCVGQARAQSQPPIEITELTLGILASEGATRALEAWTPTVSLLNRSAIEQELPYRFKIEPHTDTSLLEELSNGGVDLFLGDPAAFVVAEVEEGARALLSTSHMWQGRSYDHTGAVVFTRDDSPVRRFEDIVGKRVMGVNARELTGWQLALQEFRKYRLQPDDIASDVLFSGGNQREVVYAVQNGLVDVGVIRAGVLETLAEQGAIDLQEFRPIAPVEHAGYPYWVSTPLFPDWVMGSMPDVPEEALALLIDTLLRADETSPEALAAGGVVWQAPQNYQSVHELLISLRARPYENYLRRAAARIYSAYKWPVLGLSTAILLSIMFLVYELRRNALLAEARKNVLQSEVRSKQFYRNAVEEHTVFCMLTKDGLISHVNERFLTALDRTRGSLMRKSLSEILVGSNQILVESQIMEAMNAGVTWQGALQLDKEDGKAAWIQCTFIPVTSTSEKLSEIAIVASDVTKTRDGISETRFNNTLELIQDQVIVLRPGKLEIVYANSAAEQRLITERTGGNWKGKTVQDFITNEDFETLKMRCDALATGPQRRVTWEVEGKNDVTYEISLEYAQPEQDAPCLIAIYRDVSERKVIEKAKNEFIATVSHELRTPLTSMKGALGLALSGAVGEVPEKMNGVINMAATSCDRLVVLINDILDLEKIEAGKMDYKMHPFDLSETVTDALASNKFYAEKFDVTVRRIDDVPDATFMTYGDPTRLTQVMDNLMSNAAKFSNAGSEILVSLREADGRLRISIRDFGGGIPEKAQPTIFDKFTQADSSDTRSKGGTGLGLSIVKLIVEHHQGSVSFVSREGVGTEFFVDLPKVDGENVVPIPRTLGKILVPNGFSDEQQEAIAIVPEVLGKTAVERLVDQTRRTGLEVDFELGRVTALQVAKGRGVVGNSSVMNWIGKAERTFLNDLLRSGDVTDRDICLLEVTHLSDPNNTAPLRNIAAAELVQEWFMGCADLLGGGADLAMLAIADDPLLKIWLEEHSIACVADSAQVSPHPIWPDTDVIAQFGLAGDAAMLTLYPKAGGRLPAEWPVTLIVSRMAATQSGLGVVSKFSSGGGRRRA